MRYPIEFFNELVESDRLFVLTCALKTMRSMKVSQFKSEKELKDHLYLIEQVERILEAE